MSKKEDIIKKQHYVPRFYLKKFCERNKTINVFDKEQLKIFSTNINNIACENYFYDCDFNIDNPLKRQEAEHLISSIESEIAIVYHSVLNKLDNYQSNKDFEDLTCITNKEKEYLALFFILQLNRTKKQRIAYANIFKSMVEKVAELLFQKEIPIQVYNDKFTMIQIQRLFKNIEFYIEYLMNQQWIFERNISNRPFYTSDNPAVLDNTFCIKDGRGKDLLSPRITLHLPLSPKYTLTIVEQSLLKNMTDLTDKICNVNEENVLFNNDIQLLKSLSQVYAPSKTYFQGDEAYYKENNLTCLKNTLPNVLK